MVAPGDKGVDGDTDRGIENSVSIGDADPLASMIIDVDGVTGGFNFQAAWTTAHLAATAIANSIVSTITGSGS